VTPQQAQAQALIHEIDSVLNKASPRLPWVMTNEDAQQRQLLHQLRAYLATSVRTPATVAPPQRAAGGEETGPMPPSPVQSGQLDAMQQTLHAMMQEINHLRSTVIQPLQMDIVGLQQQRALLQQEVAQLESQRQAAIAAATPPPAAINQQVLHEMLQLLMQRLQESLSQQITQQINQALHPLQAALQSAQELSPASEAVGMLTGVATSQVQNLEALQARSDQILSTIDTTLRVVFESMQRNLESYQESLSRGLERMHGLGQQSEAQFAALLNHLAQRLGQEASAYLQTSLQSARLNVRPEAQGLIAPEGLAGQDVAASAASTASPSDALMSPLANRAPMAPAYRSEPDPLPFAGTELGASEAGTGGPSSRRVSQIVTPSAQRAETLQLEDLDLSDFNLDALDTSLIDAEGLETEDADLAAALAADEPLGTWVGDRAAPPSQPATATETTDATLDFLSQLAETFDAPPLSREDSQPPTPTPASEIEGSTTAELRELYQSLFGSDEFSGTAPTAAAPGADVPSEADAPSQRAARSRDRAATEMEADLATLGNLFGEIDATIHPDNFELVTEPALTDSWLSDGEAAAADLAESLDAMADIGADLADLPGSLEDFFFPDDTADDTAARPPTASAEPPMGLPSEDEALTLDDLALGESLLDTASPPAPSPGPIAPETASPDLPDLDTDPFNLGALAAELGEPSASTADLADLLAGLGDAEAAPSGLPVSEVTASSASVEDSFDAAAPEEDLLADVALQPTGSLEALQLDDHTLQQLSEDLFSLESGEFATAMPASRRSSASPAPTPASTPAPTPDSLADWASPDRGLPAMASVPDRFSADLSEVAATPPVPDLSVEAFAADLFGDRADVPATPANPLTNPITEAPIAPPTGRSTSLPPDQSGDADPSLVVLEDLFTDRGEVAPGDRVPAAPPAPLATPSVPPITDDRADAVILEDLFADFGDLDAGSKTAENNLASFQLEFPVPEAEDSAKKKF